MEKYFRGLVVAVLICVAGEYLAAAQTTVIDLSKNGADQIWQGASGVANVGFWFDQGELGTGDNRRDLIMGAPGTGTAVGHVYIMFGGHVASGQVNIATASDSMFTGANAGDGFGWTTAAGNVLTTESSGSLRDLAIAAPAAAGGKGIVYLFRGGLAIHSSYTTADAVATIIGRPGDQLGTALATGDMNGDGYREIVIGAPGNNRVYFVAGGPSMTGTIDLSSATPLATLSAGGIGSVLAAGDMNGDGRYDVFMGSPSSNVVYGTMGKATAYAATPEVQFTGADAGDRAGAALRVLDFDADGRRDLVISAPDGDGPSNSRADAGDVYVIWGSAAFAGKSLAAADVTFYGSLAGAHTGSFLAAGDINRDTPNDLAFGLTNNGSGGTQLDIYYGRARNTIGVASGSARVVDLATPGEVSRWILSTPAVGAMGAAIVFEVTGEGARDIIVGIPGAGGGAGGAYFTISPKMLLNKSSVSLTVNEGGTASGSVTVVNPSPAWVSWGATGSSNWLTASPASGFAAQNVNGTVNVTAATSGLAPGAYTGTLNVASTSADLMMTLPVSVSLMVTGTRVAIDSIAPNATVSQPFGVGGWAVDVAAASGTGVDRVEVYAYPNPGSGQAPLLLGAAAYGGARSDIGGLFGSRFTNSGYSLPVGGLTPGTTYRIVAFARSTITGTFMNTYSVTMTVAPTSSQPEPTPPPADPPPTPSPDPSPSPEPTPDPTPDPTPTPGDPATFSLSRSSLNFGLVRSGSTITHQTPAQALVITQHAGGTMNWTVSTSHPWLQISTPTGTGSGAFTVSIDGASLPSGGNVDATLAVSSPDASTQPQIVTIRLRQMAAGSTAAPQGAFDTPTNNAANVVGAIPVTGWAIDDVAVDKVQIWRDPVNGEPVAGNGKVFIADAVFVAGARPDVESLAASTPMNYRAGWGYLLLTNVLPDVAAGKGSGGNGTFTLHAYAVDAEGAQTYLGSKTITCANSAAVKPFGTIDTPGQGETVSGSSYISFGWALSPKSSIPADGSTINVYIDGVDMGHPMYNQRRSDIAGAFPGYSNSEGAVGVFVFDTTKLTNGVHTIGWFAVDAAGNAEGLGSRFFTVFNGSSSSLTTVTAATTATSGAVGSQVGQRTEALSAVPVENEFVEVRRAFTRDNPASLVAPDWSGRIRVRATELEQVEVALASGEHANHGDQYEGYMLVGSELRPLPSGSALRNGVFTWQAGPGFVGNYDFVFVRSDESGVKTKVPVRVTISPKR